MNRLENLVLEDNKAQGVYPLFFQGAHHAVPVFFDLEEEEEVADLSAFDELIDEHRPLLEKLASGHLDKLFTDIAKELTDGAYSQMEHGSLAAEYEMLKNELGIHSISFYPGACMMKLYAPQAFPDMVIHSQLTEEGEVEDISTEMNK